MNPISKSIGKNVNKGGTRVSGQLRPNSLNSICPYCSAKATFTLRSLIPSSVSEVWQTVSSCPACSEKVFFTIHYLTEQTGENPTDISMFPSPSNYVQPIELPCEIPDALSSAIRDAESAFGAGLYSPTVTCAGRALEGLLKHISQSGEKNLFRLIDEFCNSDKAAEPIRKLSHTMREGRNVAAHFDEKIIPDHESALIMIELLHYLVSYLFLFGEKAEKLSSKLR